ncbi:rhoptry protein [Cryptosporidium ryanae]|uniref:rhoptry protein n=1 Tax=Cryptosporidium ryanae TaxID=515981 RepID=UPI00351AA20B|nr:rhoptry protein [Cryptosporidium ryanae]
MYPQSPRNSFIANVKESDFLLNDISLSSTYPNSSNDSCCKLKIDVNRENSYKHEFKTHFNVNVSNEAIESHYNKVFFNQKEDNFDSKCCHHSEESKHPRSKIAEELCKQNSNKNIQIESILTENQFEEKDRLIGIINKQKNEFNVLKLQYNELRKKELDWERNCELSTAKQNDMKATIISLENKINDLKRKECYKVNTLSRQLQNSKKNEFYNKIDQIINICNDIYTNKIDKNDYPEVAHLLSELVNQETAIELNNELQTIIKEKDELLEIVNCLSSRHTIFDIPESNSENLRQLILSMFDQMQILSFKLNKSNKSKEKIITQVMSAMEAIENGTEVNLVVKLLKEQLRKF